MKLVIQRVKKASVSSGGEVVGKIDLGLFILIGVSDTDTLENARKLAEKVYKMRLMRDDEDKMNKSVSDVNGEFLLVSQFTLYADTAGGNRPSFIHAARPEMALPIYEKFVQTIKDLGGRVQIGSFGNYMEIETILDGPVTIVVEG